MNISHLGQQQPSQFPQPSLEVLSTYLSPTFRSAFKYGDSCYTRMTASHM
jgi:hypothetical protein